MTMDKTFNAAQAEQRLYDAWEKAGCFKAGANAKPEASSYAIMIPPPNVTGVLHMGHAFNNTLQDILIRWKRMQGFDTLWQPGTDHAGIATQMVVERRLAENNEPGRVELGREKFLEKVWEWKAESGGTIRDQLKRLGASCDWSREAFTMSGAPGAPADMASGNFHDAVIKVFVEMYNKGLIYRGKRLVNWDPHFETAISDLEVENIETPGHMWHFKYPLAGGETYEYVEKDEDGAETLREIRDYISIATTRPETMLGDGAVAVNPKDERYASIVGKLCEIPVGPKEFRRLIPIIVDDYPDTNFGSGAVKITGAHDFNDYLVAKRGKLPMYNLMDTKAAMRADGKPYAEEAAIAQAIANGEQEFDEAMIAAMNLVPEAYRGMGRFAARAAVIADVTAEGLAVMQMVPVTDAEGHETVEAIPFVENKPVMQPYGDRSKVVIEPMLTDQWFVETDKIVGPALDAVKNGDIKIMPESGEKVYYNWLENIEPWCISRQLWWGHQIPVWYGPSIGSDGNWDLSKDQFFCGSNYFEAKEKAANYYSSVAPWIETIDEYLPANDAIGGQDLEEEELEDRARTRNYRLIPAKNTVKIGRDPDVLDTWFSSGLWPIGTLGWPEKTDALDRYFPTSDLVTGQDILFFWVARMIMMQLAVAGEIPFDTVYLHGLVRDAKGKKMSKSTGNVIDPLDTIDEYGADALRFANAAMASLGGVLKFDEQRIAGYRNFGTKLWNAGSYGVSQIDAFSSERGVDAPDATLTVNRWIIGEVGKLRVNVDASLTAYRFNDAATALYSFIWNKYCAWYLEFTKPIFFGEDEAAKEETRKVYAWAFEQCLILLHPIMPFITEELWQEAVGNDDMLMMRDWPTYGLELVDATADAEMNWVISLIETVRSARGEVNVPAALKVPLVQVDLDDAGKTAWANNEALIMKLARIETLSEASEAPKGSVTIPVLGGAFALPLAGIIDVDAEKARLEKGLGKLAKELGGLRGRLKNPKFAESAPADVVEETKVNLAEREAEEEKIKAALARLAELS